MNIRKLTMTTVFGCFAVIAPCAQTSAQADQSSPAQQVEPMEKTPVFRANVVSRTTKAVDYRHRGGSTHVDLKGTELMPQVNGEARVESKAGRLEINAKLSGMEPANKFGLEYLTYVFWAVTPEGRANNLGEVVLENGKSELHVTTALQAFGLIITAEPYFAVTQPSDLVVAQNIVRSSTKGRVEAIDVRYELLPRGLYAAQVEPLRDVVYGVDSKAPLDLFEARNAVRIARAAKAEQYATTTFAKAEQDLKQAEDYYRRKQGRTPIGTVAREASQTAEEARVMSLKRQEEERVQAEKDAAAAREAQSKADAERSKQDAERSKEQAELEAQKSALQKQQADAAQAAALAQQQALQAENEKTRLQAEEAERGRQKAEADKAQLRARLLQQLNAILITRDTARGLVATMPDVLFETNSFTLRPRARESLAKFAGILLAYPELRLEVDGHTDSTGSDEYNQQLSEKRATSVRDYLVQQGVPISAVAVMGFGKTEPIASNATASGRQQNRRVELVVSGEVIGTPIGSNSRPQNGPQDSTPEPPQPQR
jgi:outer membrane protein OmpA-like peptidoglycan-associated protein